MCDSIIASCNTCGKSFRPSKYKSSKFCSVPCYRVHQRSGEYKSRESKRVNDCSFCGSTVIGRSFSKVASGGIAANIYCGRECYDAARASAQKALEKKCAGCGEMFYRSGVMSDAIYCNAKCRKACNKPDPVRCVLCNCLFSALQIRTGDGAWYVRLSGRKTCSQSCLRKFYKTDQARKDKISAAFSGEKHPNWQGGKSLWNTINGRGLNWKSQRSKALKRDGNKCVMCAMTAPQCLQAYGRTLDVDHIIPFHNFSSYKKANTLGNLQSVCASCHKIEESKRSMVQMLLPMQESMTGQHKPRRIGENHPKAIMSYEKADEARKMVSSGMTYKDTGVFFGVGESTIGLIVRRKLWVR